MAVDPDSTAKVAAGPSDVELVRAYRAGDIHAFEELHRRYVGSIYRLVRRKLGDALLAEDISQETFLKALRMLDRVDDSFNFGGWVHTVARNLCYDELRRRQRDLRVEENEEDDTDLLASLPSTSRSFDPVQMQESNELRRQVWTVAQRLPEKYRKIIFMRHFKHMDVNEIACALNKPEGTIKSRIRTGLMRLRHRLLEQGIDESWIPS